VRTAASCCAVTGMSGGRSGADGVTLVESAECTEEEDDDDDDDEEEEEDGSVGCPMA
jgi:hypothetical protein